MPSWTPYVKYLRYLVEAAAYWTSGALSGLATDAAVAADVETRRAMFVFSRTTPTGTVEDDATFSLHVVNITSGEIDPTWTGGDYTTVNTAMSAFWTTIKAQMSTTHTLKQIRYYREGPEIAHSGPPEAILTVGETGTASGVVMPYQVSSTCTLHTAFPKHWGRIYVPGIPTSFLASFGRLNTTYVDTLAGAVHTLNAALATAGFALVVVSRQNAGIMSVSAVHADDVPDIQRRRRAKQVSYRKSYA